MQGTSVKASRDFFEPASARKLSCEVSLIPWQDDCGKLVGVLVNIGQWELALASRLAAAGWHRAQAWRVSPNYSAKCFDPRAYVCQTALKI